MTLPMDRAGAYALMCAHTKTLSLQRHALAVEAAMRAMAAHYGEDQELWGMAGLLHDLDYEEYPEEHCDHSPRMLEEAGFGPAFIRAVLSHGYGMRTDVEPQSLLEKSLFAVDELTGLITACVYVRPSRSIMDLEVSSVKKKWKDKAFAAGCNRAVIQQGADSLPLEWSELCAIVIAGMKDSAQALGLVGEA